MKRLLFLLLVIMMATTLMSGLIWYIMEPSVDTALPIILSAGYY